MTDVEPIKRYEVAAFATHTGDSWFEEYESEDGDYVKYEDHKRELDAEKARAAANSCESAPEPQTIRVTGTMDMMHVSRASFALSLDDGTEVRGILQHGEVQDHKELLGSRVLVTGRLVYRPSGLPLRIEAERVEPTNDRNALWSTLPQGRVRRSGTKGLRRLQASGKGVSGFFGILGDDEDEAAQHLPQRK